MKELVRAAAVQAEPVWFDASGTTGKTIALIEEAARGGAEIVAFPEVWIPGYPAFMVFAGEAELPLVAEYRANAVSIDGPELGAIRHAAAENHIMVGLGFAERAGRSLYMSQAVISSTGELRIARRKLKPTHRERALYGQGDGSDLQVIDTPLGRVGALMCWEHLQPFNKMAMIAEGEQIHISSWPMLDFFGANMMSSEAITTVNRAYAMESGTFVLMASQTISAAGRAAMSRHSVELPEFQGGGAACIIAPDTTVLTEQLTSDAEGIVYADLSMRLLEISNYLTDPAGHYSRPDVYRFTIDRTRRRSVEYLDDALAQSNERTSAAPAGEDDPAVATAPVA
ncbi:carbon-nitrogen hydrolase family protein [Streptomyces malaysiensis]|uniref:carbon-nitrogen hydrolase family protein n=1 Tax=Streptomyces malaysiensis TaxID=92644 RepID=UPI000852EFF8|nr:carbon-nitrogen hydrolase family protein [Streptomyces sp. SPMA113]